MTPQPQPAAYWIELLEELTDCVPFKLLENGLRYYTLYDFVKYNLDYREWDLEVVKDILQGIQEYTSGQNVIDASTSIRLCESEDITVISDLNDEWMEQIDLYLRCNGIKR